MEDNQEVPQEEVVEQPEQVDEQPTETVEELKKRLENAQAENRRKAMELARLKEERNAPPAPTTSTGVDLTKYRDVELKAALKDPTNSHMHDGIEEELHSRRIRRIQNEEAEKALRLNTELERQKNYPETFDPTHPMAVRMSELMSLHRLEHTPSGRLVAAKLAASELQQAKAKAVGRKQEQDRQADVKANFQGESARPAPKVSDKVKLEELKKKAMSGDSVARTEWYKHKGLI